MPASAIAAILLRLYALNLAVTGLVQSIMQGAAHFMGGSAWIYSVIPAFTHLIVGATLWFIAPPFARFLAARHDEPFRLEGLNEAQLYSATFLGLGLWFSLSSFAGVFNWLHYFAVVRSNPDLWKDEDGTNLYSLSREALTLAAGLLLVFTGPVWAVKLASSRRARVKAIES